jgi:toxin ParE1/3/4
MNPIWSPEVIADLAALRAYVSQDDPAAAQRVALHIIRNVETLLPNSPEMGRPGRVPETRELVIPRTPYIVPYSSGRQYNPSAAGVPQCTPVARRFLRRVGAPPRVDTSAFWLVRTFCRNRRR